MTHRTDNLVPAVDRAVRILARLGVSREGRGISELARELDIPKSSAFQIAATLVHHGLLDRDERTRRYRLGPGLARLAGAARVDLIDLATPRLAQLAATTRLTALLGVRDADGILLAAKQESPEPIGISAPLGHRLGLRAGVFGKVFAAGLQPAELEVFLRHSLPAYTARSITDPCDYRKDLVRVRTRGYAIDEEEYLDGVAAVGAPICDPNGKVVAGICLLGLSASLSRSRLGEAGERACAAAAELSRALGFRAATRRDERSGRAGR